MNKTVLHNVMILLCGIINAQNQNIPEAYLQDIASEVGVWIADNSYYKNEYESYESYAIEWKFGLNKMSLTGRLYCLKDGQDPGTFWEFKKYWDSEKEKTMVMQFVSDGTIGVGPWDIKNEKVTELLQTVINPDDSTYKVGHKTVTLNDLSHTGSSFFINENSEWLKDRTYTWHKQIEEEEKKVQSVTDSLHTIIGTWSGKGQLFGKEAQFKMTWATVLENKFYELTFSNEYTDDKNIKRSMKARGFYEFVNDKDIVGDWFDSRGMILPLKATFQNSQLTVFWGDESSEQGKTIYIIEADKTISATDYFKANDTFTIFGTAKYSIEN